MLMKPNKAKKIICVIDGQGGGIGGNIIKQLKSAFGESFELIGLGTNAIATGQMIRAGANRGASGENAIIRTVNQADLIICSVSVTWANSMLGEVTPGIAEAVMSCAAPKIVLPLSQENVVIVGVRSDPLPHIVKDIVDNKIMEALNHV